MDYLSREFKMTKKKISKLSKIVEIVEGSNGNLHLNIACRNAYIKDGILKLGDTGEIVYKTMKLLSLK